jgi:hypothetical protein
MFIESGLLIFVDWGVPFSEDSFGISFTKKLNFGTQKMENVVLCKENEKSFFETLFAFPRYTLVCKMGSFQQIFTWSRP